MPSLPNTRTLFKGAGTLQMASEILLTVGQIERLDREAAGKDGKAGSEKD